MTVTVSQFHDVAGDVEVYLAHHETEGEEPFDLWWAHCRTCDWDDARDTEGAAVAIAHGHSSIVHRCDDDGPDL